MNETKKTIAFACVGGLMLALAGATYFMTQPTTSAGFEALGQPFFENFTDSTSAKSLEVYAIDPDSAKRKRFVVKEDGGIWRIPSHHDYPAEAADRLATTASSLIGIEREALKGKHKSEHERFGVLDPNDPDVLDPESTGKRVTMKDDSGDVLVDLIIGNRVENDEIQPEQMVVGQNVTTDRYYVRHPEENQTYVVSLDLDLSTKFSDWIRPDLLQIENSEIEMLHINNYEIAGGAGGRLIQKQGDQLWMRREGGAGSWKLDGVNEETETFEEAKATTAVSTLDELKIAGVRPKMEYQDQPLITADLKINEIPELMKEPEQFNMMLQQLQVQLIEYGFNLLPTEVEGQLKLVSSVGELEVGTSAGVLYTLQFGKTLDGDEDEIEIGLSSDSEAAAESSAEETGEGETSEAEEKANDENIKNRYAMVRVSFDEKLLSGKPVKPEAPVEPVKPEGYAPAAEPEKPSDEDAAPEPGTEGKAEGDEPAEEETAKEERDPKFVEYDKLVAEFENKKTQYELELTRFEDQTKSFGEQIEKGKERVKELNERFGAWFYVISADNLKTLQLQRSDLVSVKEKPNAAAPEGGLPDRPNLNFNMDGIPGLPNAGDEPKMEAAEDPSDVVPETPDVPDAPEVKTPETLEQSEVEKAGQAAGESAEKPVESDEAKKETPAPTEEKKPKGESEGGL